MKTVIVSIKGITPLLMHRFPMDGADAPGKKRTGVPDWQAEGERGLYKDEKGQIYEPASHLDGAIKQAAKSFKIQGRRGASYSKLVASTVVVVPEAVPHKLIKYVIDARPVVIQRARIIRYRPRFDEWALDFTLQLLDDQLPVDIVKQVLDHAGLYIGIGDYRPDKGGKFGKFMVTKFEEIV